jgi:HAMP domain-containing protein
MSFIKNNNKMTTVPTTTGSKPMSNWFPLLVLLALVFGAVGLFFILAWLFKAFPVVPTTASLDNYITRKDKLDVPGAGHDQLVVGPQDEYGKLPSGDVPPNYSEYFVTPSV